MVKPSRFIIAALAVLISTTSLFAQERGRRIGFAAQTDSIGKIESNTLGDLTADLLYTPLAQPCRIIDTRVAQGAFAAGETRNLYTIDTGIGEIAGQGGTAGGCGIPAGAAVVHMNFVAVSPTGTGNFKAAAYGQPIPTTGSVINYAAVTGLNIANGINMPICAPSAGVCPWDFTLQANAAGTHLVVDVLGYFRKHRGAFIHTATASNTSAHITTIDNSLTNNNPNAILLITHNWGSVAGGIYDTHVSSVFYDTGTNKWDIFHDDLSPMTANEMFNVLVLNP